MRKVVKPDQFRFLIAGGVAINCLFATREGLALARYNACELEINQLRKFSASSASLHALSEIYSNRLQNAAVSVCRLLMTQGAPPPARLGYQPEED
jgi:hypothetical protein